MRGWPRRIFHWKFVFYNAVLPALRRLGPARGDRWLGWLGRLALALQPGRRARLRGALHRAEAALGSDWPVAAVWPELAANTARFLARDYPLDDQSDEAALARFDVRGAERLRVAMNRGRGAVLVGSHLGAHIAGAHWLYRRGVPVRLLVQRPRHVSRALNDRFDAGGPYPQAEFFLKRDLSPTVAVERLLRARAALRDGLAVYLNGDIPWSGPNTCPGRLLGRSQRFLAIWTELAVLTRAPVFLMFCTHAPNGRFALDIEPLGRLRAGEEPAAVADYLRRLEHRIDQSPGDAIAHLVWPCYAPRSELEAPTRARSGRPLAWNARGARHGLNPGAGRLESSEAAPLFEAAS